MVKFLINWPMSKQ